MKNSGKLTFGLAILGVACYAGYELYRYLKGAAERVDKTIEKANLGIEELTEYLKNKNEELEMKVTEKKKKMTEEG